MIIYIDIILLENLVMNFIILYATATILKIKVKIFRLFISSLLGAIYVILEYISSIKLYTSLILKIFLGIIIISIAFYPKTIKTLFKDLLIFYLVSFTFGGVATYLIYVLRPQDIVIKNGYYSGTYILKIIFIAAIVGTMILMIAFKVVKNKMTNKDIKCKVKIRFGQKETEISAIVDTGNMLKEPLSGNSVIIVEKNMLSDIIPKEILDNIENILGGNFNKISDDIKNEYMPKIKVIPFSSLGMQNGILLGIKPESVKVIDENSEIEKENVIIGLYEKSLTKRGEYNALIGIDLY